MSRYAAKITVEAEFDEEEVLADIISTLETILPYMTDNVIVSSHITDYTPPERTVFNPKEL